MNTLGDHLRVVSTESAKEWKASLTGPHDWYHLPFYHRLATDVGLGVPKLFVYENAGISICLPLLIRRIAHLPTEGFGQGDWYDATSVYGYAGPTCSHSDVPEAVANDFRDQLTRMLVNMRIVSVFSRLHPFLDQEPLLKGLGAVVDQGQTVSIDLGIPEDAQVAQYRENHRRSLKRIAQAGTACLVDEDFRYLDTFVEIYANNMRRVGATEDYIFPRAYFRDLASTTEAEVKLIVCTVGSEVACAGIFVKYGDILHYHLGGTGDAWLKLSPLKLVLDSARHWGFTHGAKVFHLGGGVGARNDSLFQFKLGFSNRLHSFKTWRWILIPSVYDQLVAATQTNLTNALNPEGPSDFFPRYRWDEDSTQFHPTVS